MNLAAFFDLDRTLIDCNSGPLWMRSEWKAGRLGLREVAWGAWWTLKYHAGVEDGLEQAFEAAISALEDADEQEFESRTRDWFADEVAPHLRPGARAAIDSHRERGDRLVLATSGTIYSARAAVDTWDLDVALGTVPEAIEGRFTGRITTLAVGAHKHSVVQDWARSQDIDLRQSTFYTDSITDRALLEAVGNPVIVNPDRPLARLARERGWPIVDWGRA